MHSSLCFSFSVTNSDWEGNLGSILHMVLTLEGTLMAGPWIDLCLPHGNATIFMKGKRSLSFNGLRPDSSDGKVCQATVNH